MKHKQNSSLVDQRTTLFDKVCRDHEGRLALAMKPNLPILVWFITEIAKLVWRTGESNRLLVAAGYGSLFTWAWLELFQGVNYFRRGLGFVILCGLIMTATRNGIS